MKFKIGDRVKIAGTFSVREGDMGEVIDVVVGCLYPYLVKFSDGETINWREGTLELVRDEVEFKFKVGDKVKIIKDTISGYDYFVDGIGEIVNVSVDYGKVYKVKLYNGCLYNFKEDEIELCKRVISKKDHLTNRVKDLCEALYEESKEEDFCLEDMREWAAELADKLYDFEYL